MLTTTHLAIAVLIGMLLNLNRDEWVVALSFGVLIDADHLFAAPRYVGDNGLGAILRPSWDDGSGLPWRSLIHYPIGAFVVLPLSVGWRFMIPALFWGVHLVVDQLQAWLIHWNTPAEAALLTGACAGIVLIWYRRWLDVTPDGDFRQFIRAARMALSSSFIALGRSVR